MKRSSLFIIYLFAYFCCIINVSAIENPSCKYVNSENEKDTIVVTIYLDKEEINSYAQIKAGEYLIEQHNGFANIKVGSEYPFSNTEYTMASEYWEGIEEDHSDANERCPDYFYVCNTGSYYVGLFSDISYFNKVVGVCDAGIYVSEAQQLTENASGELETLDERYSCTLFSEKLNDFSLSMEINYTDKTISFSTDQGISDTDYVEKFNYELKNKPPSDLKVCYNVIEKSNTVGAFGNYYIYKKDDTTFEDKYLSNAKCYDLTEKVDNMVGSDYCKYFKGRKDAYNDALSINQYGTASKIKEKLKSYCKNLLMYSDYDPTEYSCENMCLNISEYFPEEISISISECGLSEKLIKFIMNIIKWAKYIIPVAVIILGIIDFLRAIGSEKDDGIKKAQGRFIRRIIAAALIFIIPFILEFIIEKMGFISDTCGII